MIEKKLKYFESDLDTAFPHPSQRKPSFSEAPFSWKNKYFLFKTLTQNAKRSINGTIFISVPPISIIPNCISQKGVLHLPLDKMIEKAYELIMKKRIERVGEEFYNVVGEHGTYTVARKIDGSVSCSCPGFRQKGKCSHSFAVLMLNDRALFRNVQKEFRKARRHFVSESTQR